MGGRPKVTPMEPEVFSHFSQALRAEVKARFWERATAIQALAIPSILKGRNVLLIAPTGTGKTEAAVFPVFEQFLRRRRQHPSTGLSILYITPLRALNRDVFRRLIDTGERLGITVQVRHGDTTTYARRKQALQPPDMLITTPETLQAILPGKRMSRHLRSVRWVVVDEVHELATSKRGSQLAIGLERLQRLTGREFQRIGLSATVGSPQLIASFLCGGGRTCHVLKAVDAKDLEAWVESPTAGGGDRKTAKQVALSPGGVKRIRRLIELMEGYKASLVFTNTREHAEALASRMRALRPDLRIGVHHGSLSKAARMDAETALKAGQLKAVVCTSSLELGIDVGDIEFVVQYLSPKQVTRLVQRVGRSGHGVQGRSRGCVLAAWPDDILESAVIAKFAFDDVLEPPTIHAKARDVLAHQVVGLALDEGGIRLGDVFEVVTAAWPYSDLQRDELTAVVKQLGERGMVWFEGDIIRKRGAKSLRYYYNNLSMIPEVKRYGVVDFLRRKHIGTLDQEFVAKNGTVGQEFIMRGQTWRLISVDDAEDLVQVEPVQQSFGAIPAWEGEMIPVPFPVAREVGRLRGVIAVAITRGEAEDVHLEDLPLDHEAAAKVVDAVKRQLHEQYPVPTDRRVLIEGFEHYAVIHGCFGTRVNEALGKAVAALLSSRLGINIGTQVDAYRIALIAPRYLDPRVVGQELRGIMPKDLEPLLSTALGGTSLFAWRIWNVAKRFGRVSRDAVYRSRRGRVLASLLEGTPIYAEALREIYVEKMDVKLGETVLEKIQEGTIEVDIVHRRREYSPFALPILDRIAPQDILRPAVPMQSLIEVVRERLGTTEIRLVCVFKGDYNGVRTLRRIPEKIECPICGSTLVAGTHPSDRTLVKIVRKKIAHQKVTADEEREWRRAWKSASLVQTYGKKSLMTLAARGVGPTTAVRILRKYHRSEDDFYADIIRAEREYARTRMFWDS